MKTIDILKDGILLPPKPGLCQECATDHAPDFPHNAESLYYQMQFKKKYNRWPTWADAIAHLSAEAQEKLKVILRQNGIKI
jgi:hypothetical protein